MRGDIEDCKHAIAERLRSGDFVTALAAVDTEKADGLLTPSPTFVFEGEKNPGPTLGYPVGEVIGVKTLYDRDDTYSKRAQHEIHIAWTQVGTDEMTITTHVERLVKATRDLFWPTADEPVVFPSIHAGPLQFVSEDYTHLAPHVNKASFVKGSWTVVLVPTFTT